MNSQVRLYLIEVARKKDKFVYYSDVVKDCKLAFDLSTEKGQQQLSSTLGEVSEYENQFGRPLVSSLTIYKDTTKNDHGDGFYRLAERLGKGKMKQLREDLYAFIEAEKSRRFWQDESHYKQFAQTESVITPTERTEKPSFFTEQELEFFKQWQYKAYDPSNPEHVAAKNYLMETVWEKTIYLGKQVLKSLSGFSMEGGKYWSQRGWKEDNDGGNTQAAIFKPYTWVKIYKNTDEGKDIFFTFGLDAWPETEAFIYKIDCQQSRDSKLSTEQVELCKSLIPKTASWNEISFETLPQENWENLIATCVNFINEHLVHYTSIMDAVWGRPVSGSLFKDTLLKRDQPDGLDETPEQLPIFKGVDIDFLSKAQDQKDLGDAGEALVVKREIEFLKSKNKTEDASKVRTVKDGEGYDVYSFDEFGNEKFIEVKTTKGNQFTPFYLSRTELSFLQQHQGKDYSIYRIYHYDKENNFGEYFELSGNIEKQLDLKPIQYQVKLKKKTTQ